MLVLELNRWIDQICVTKVVAKISFLVLQLMELLLEVLLLLNDLLL